MQYKEDIEMINKFTEKIQDTESEKLFDARFSYFIDRDKDCFYKKLDSVLLSKERNYHCWRLEEYYNRNPQNREKSIVVFGAGEMGKVTCRSLRFVNKKAECICDNNEKLDGTEYQGIPVHNFNYVCQNFKESIIIVAVSDRYHQAGIYHQLILAGFREADILMSDFGGIFCDIPNQYFDVTEVLPETEGEYFVDAGCCNGSTSLQCSKWCSGNLKMVYAFEPDNNNYPVCDRHLSSIGCGYELYDCAAWNGTTILYFHQVENAGWASNVSETGEVSVKADSIDNRLRGRKATYIKMDIEGSELEALKGSVQTMRKYRPKLAISLYHKPEDVIQIPVFLEKLDLGYKYYLRHYQTRMEETILYAI